MLKKHFKVGPLPKLVFVPNSVANRFQIKIFLGEFLNAGLASVQRKSPKCLCVYSSAALQTPEPVHPRPQGQLLRLQEQKARGVRRGPVGPRLQRQILPQEPGHVRSTLSVRIIADSVFLCRTLRRNMLIPISVEELATLPPLPPAEANHNNADRSVVRRHQYERIQF